MKLTIKLLSFLFAGYMLSSCLDGDPMNTPPGGSSPFIMMTNNPSGGNTVNSGLRYFGSQALTYPADHLRDTAKFAVSIQGLINRDVNVTLTTPADALDDYYYKDSITYEMMPDALWDFLGPTSAVIPAGKQFAEFQVIFYPSLFDPTKNYMLPISATNDADLQTSSNYGVNYYHVIGNPIAGSYNWDFIRINNQAGTGAPAGGSFTDETIAFAPESPTAINVPTGYFVQPNYLITFKNTGGVLSNFKAVIDPDEIDAAFTLNGISMVSGPTISVNTTDPAHPIYTVNYVVFNGAAFRNCTDIYTKK